MMKRQRSIRLLVHSVVLVFFASLFGYGVAHAAIPEQATGPVDVHLPLVMNGGGLPPIIPDTTKVLSVATTQHLTSVSGDGSMFAFSQSTSELDALAAGDVMVADVSAAAPHGFLRKVVGVSQSGGQVIVNTETATLEDAIEQGEISLSKRLTPADIEHATMADGVSLLRSAVPELDDSFYFGLNNVVLYDEDGDLGTTNDQLKANGSLEFSSGIDFDLLVQDRAIQELEFTLEMAETAELELLMEVEIVSVEARYEIARIHLGNIVASIGPVPVVFVIQLPIYLRADGDLSVGVVASVTQNATLTAGLRYQNRQWRPISSLANDFDFEPPRPTAGVNVKGYFDPQLSLLLYGVAGPFVAVVPYLEFRADIYANPWWTLYAGINATAGVKTEVLGRSLGEHTEAVVGYRILLAQAEDNSPPNGGKIAFARYLDSDRNIYVMNDDGTGQTNLTSNLAVAYLPAWSPDGSKIAFNDYGGIYVMNADGSDQKQLTAHGSRPIWSPEGSKIAFQVFGGNDKIYVMNADGSGQTNLTNDPEFYDSYPVWSPDSRKIAFISWRDGGRDIYVTNIDGTDQINLTNNWAEYNSLAWSPDGDRIVYAIYHGDIFVMNADGSNQENLTNSIGEYLSLAWSPDGSKIVFSRYYDDEDIFIMNADGSDLKNLSNNRAEDYSPDWSLNGSKIVFTSDRDGNKEVYVMNTDGSDQTNLTNNSADDYSPVWQP